MCTIYELLDTLHTVSASVEEHSTIPKTWWEVVVASTPLYLTRTHDWLSFPLHQHPCPFPSPFPLSGLCGPNPRSRGQLRTQDSTLLAHERTSKVLGSATDSPRSWLDDSSFGDPRPGCWFCILLHLHLWVEVDVDVDVDDKSRAGLYYAPSCALLSPPSLCSFV